MGKMTDEKTPTRSEQSTLFTPLVPGMSPSSANAEGKCCGDDDEE
jgi:hypothetical protein